MSQLMLHWVQQWVADPPPELVSRPHGWAEWTDEGAERLNALIDAVEQATGQYVIGRKIHGRELDPMIRHELWLTDDDVCDGGCCDGR